MNYTTSEVMQFVREEDVKFIRLGFCDVFGVQKNIAIMPSELSRAFEYGIPVDASAIAGFARGIRSDLFLRPDPSTLSVLPWRPDSGRVVRMYCSVCNPDGSIFEADSREILRKAVADAEKMGLRFDIGPKLEFYIFRTDENGEPTKEPSDRAGYLDIAPEDKGENIRREICLTLEQMGIQPESSHHEVGPGQNEVDFRYSDPLTAADNAVTFKTVVKTVAGRAGLAADFSPRPLPDYPGSGFQINFSVNDRMDNILLDHILAGIMAKIREMTLFLNPLLNSYERFGHGKAPAYVSWSHENRSQLIRIPATPQGHCRAELRSPDPAANPYLAFALLIYAGMYGVANGLELPEPSNIDFQTATEEMCDGYEKLPATLSEAIEEASSSSFIRGHVPESVLKAYCER